MSTSEQHTYTSSEQFHMEEGETMLARGTKIFVAPGEHIWFLFLPSEIVHWKCKCAAQ